MASCTRRLVFSATISGRLSTFDTVPSETPARFATSRILDIELILELFPHCSICMVPVQLIRDSNHRPDCRSFHLSRLYHHAACIKYVTKGRIGCSTEMVFF